MRLKLEFSNLLLFAAPIVTGWAIAASPSQAATLASSEAVLNIDNFSQAPQEVTTLTDTSTYTFVTNGSVTAEADANAEAYFASTNPLAGLSNLSLSQANGEGNSYLGQALSLASVTDYDFNVESGQTFSFDFNGFLYLTTSIAYPQYESASASGGIYLELFDTTTGNLLENLTISGSLANLGKNESFGYDKSAGITLDLSQTASVGKTQKSADALVNGNYSQYFATPTSLELIEFNESTASVKAISVPEPSNVLADVLFSSSIGIVLIRRLKLSRKPQPASYQLDSDN